MIEKHYLRAADRTRGRFRTFLLAALKHFLANEWDRAQAKKRGGNSVTLTLDLEAAENLYCVELVERLTPDKIFEQSWARTLLRRVMLRLREEFLRTHRPEVFESLRPFLTEGSLPGEYERTAEQAGMSIGALKVAIHRARRRFAALVREEVACTVENPSDVDDEIRYLLDSLSA